MVRMVATPEAWGDGSWNSRGSEAWERERDREPTTRPPKVRKIKQKKPPVVEQPYVPPEVVALDGGTDLLG